MPRPGLESNLRPSVGVALDDERLVVMAETRITVDWMENRHHAIERQLQRTTGRDLLLDYVVKEWL